MNLPLQQVQTTSQRGDDRVRFDGDEDRAAHSCGGVSGGPETGGLLTSAGAHWLRSLYSFSDYKRDMFKIVKKYFGYWLLYISTYSQSSLVNELVHQAG